MGLGGLLFSDVALSAASKVWLAFLSPPLVPPSPFLSSSLAHPLCAGGGQGGTAAQAGTGGTVQGGGAVRQGAPPARPRPEGCQQRHGGNRDVSLTAPPTAPALLSDSCSSPPARPRRRAPEPGLPPQPGLLHIVGTSAGFARRADWGRI